MTNIPVLVHSLGNIGRHVIACLETAPDLECLGVVRSPGSVGSKKNDLRSLPDFPSYEALEQARGKPAVAILCGPSRLVPEIAADYLARGINTVDSFDIHAEIPALVRRLQAAAEKTGRAAITAAGWDPGTDSIIRAVFEAMTPVGTTFTNFGRGRSMGHSVAARAIPGVADAVSVTIPIGSGRHARLVHILPKDGADPEEIRKKLAADPYFSHDPLDVRFVSSGQELALTTDTSHGVHLERTGASGSVANQRLSFEMRIDNPALTAQVLVSSARATTRLAPGCYTLIDVAPIALLPGERMANIKRLV